LIRNIVGLHRRQKQLIVLLLDFILINLSLWLAFSVRLGHWFMPSEQLLLVMAIAPVVAVPIFIRFGLYRAVVRYIGLKALWTIVKAISLYALIWGILGFMAAVEGIPRSVILINWLLALLSIGGLRMWAKWLLSGVDNDIAQKNVLVYGAGSSGRQLVEALLQSREYKPVAFIDDDSDLAGQSINGIRVYSRADIVTLVWRYDVQEALLALNAPSKSQQNQIIDILESCSLHVRILPKVSELAQGKIKIEDLREVSIEDVLGRDKVEPDMSLLHTNIKDKVVMVTGAGGSIGSELCRQIASLGARQLILFEQSELALYAIDKELGSDTSMSIKPILGSVMDQNRVTQVCQTFGVDTIYHAAAYKHVPMVEFNASEGINNNVFGTLSCAKAAISSKVKTFVLISTDKAVRPTNTMGATKRTAELVLQALTDQHDTTRFSIVRFGNVLDSSGSVIPLFRQQIRQGGPVTVTDSEIVRYFMTIPEAVELVIQAGAMAHGGEVFVLDMGKPVKIFDLATKMIHLSGLSVKNNTNPEGDIEICITGLRPGEKLFEELLIGNNVTKTGHPMIMKAKEDRLSWQELEAALAQMQIALDDFNQSALRELLKKVVPGFKPQCDIEDILYQK